MCITLKSVIVLEGLVQARDIVNKGWCQGQFVNYERGQYCAVGAMMSAPRQTVQEHMVEHFIEANGLKAVGSPYAKSIVITAWNDTIGRTKEEVVDAFNKAIESCLKY